MIITIIRKYFTRDICQGVMTVDGEQEKPLPASLSTLESAPPRDHLHYVGHCAPPGDYPMLCDEEAISYKGVMLHIPWLTVKEVKWFPNFQIFCGCFSDLPRRGQVFVGAVRTDNGYALENPDDEAMRFWARLSKQVHDSGEQVTLRIVEADGIQFEDTYRDKARIEAQQRAENAHREEVLNDLYSYDNT